MKVINKKYELTKENININGSTLYRIRALCNISYNIKTGDLGGFVESEENLATYGDAWVYGNAKVYGNAFVGDNAQVYGEAEVRNYARVYGNAKVHGNAIVCCHAQVYGNAEVFGNAEVYRNAQIYGNAKFRGDAWVTGNAQIYGNAEISGDTAIYGNAIIQDNRDYFVFKNWWSRGKTITWTRSNNMWWDNNLSFYGTGQELIEKAYNQSELSGREYERIVNYVESIKKTYIF